MKVHDGYDIDAFGFDAVQKAVRKPRNQEAPELVPQRRAGGRKLEQSFVRALNHWSS
jgi:hypothetical protein